MIKEYVRAYYIFLISFFVMSSVFAAAYDFTPVLSKMEKSSSQKSQPWGIHWMPGIGEIIVSGQLSQEDIQNWGQATEDPLTLHFLAEAATEIRENAQDGQDRKNLLDYPEPKSFSPI